MTDLFVSQFMKPGYEPGDGSMDGAMLVDGEWWHPLFGCDSLQHVLDAERSRVILVDQQRVQPSSPDTLAEMANEEYTAAVLHGKCLPIHQMPILRRALEKLWDLENRNG